MTYPCWSQPVRTRQGSMGAPKRSPSFSHRPGFPSGLRVLLVDSDVEARARTEEQLRACDYSVRRACPGIM